jgi:hypothetical protein
MSDDDITNIAAGVVLRFGITATSEAAGRFALVFAEDDRRIHEFSCQHDVATALTVPGDRAEIRKSGTDGLFSSEDFAFANLSLGLEIPIRYLSEI